MRHRVVDGLMSTSWTHAEEALFEKTGAAVLHGLKKVRNPADLLGVIRQAHLEFDRAEAARRQSISPMSFVRAPAQ